MKIPLSLPPTSEMSLSRLSPSNDVSCTGFREELILEKEDRDGRNGLHTEKKKSHDDVPQCTIGKLDMTMSLVHVSVCPVPLQREFPEDIVDLLQVVTVHPL